MKLIAIHKALHHSGPAYFHKEGWLQSRTARFSWGVCPARTQSPQDAVPKSREQLLCLTGVLLHRDGDLRGTCVTLVNAVERLTCVISKAESFCYSLLMPAKQQSTQTDVLHTSVLLVQG